MCAAVFVPPCHRSVSLRRKLLHHASVAISLLSTRPLSPHSLSNCDFFGRHFPSTSANTTTYEHDPRAVDSCMWENRNFPTSSICALQCFLRSWRQTPAGQASEDATIDDIPSCEVGRLLLHPHPSHDTHFCAATDGPETAGRETERRSGRSRHFS